MPALQQLLFSNNLLVRTFSNWRQGDEDESWRTKALEILVKKLKRQPGDQYSNLLLVLNTKNENTPCITIPKSQDGRLQVSHRKQLPQVIYCRVFRWPDLQSQHELRSVSTCQHPAQRRDSNKICVNPYHYARVDHPLYPPVVTSRNSEYANPSPLESPLSPASNYSTTSSVNQPQNSPTYFANNPHLTPVAQLTNGNNNNPFNINVQSPSPLNPYQQENPDDPSTSQSALNPNLQQLQQPQNNFSLSNYYSVQSPQSDSSWYTTSSNNIGPNGEPLPLAESPRQGSTTQFDSQSSPPPGYSESRSDQQLGLMPMDIADDTPRANRASSGGGEGDYWCRITYAELNQKIGEPFKGSSARIIVDGFTNPSVHNRRFSLGVLSNINRNSTIEMTRRAIRKGVCLENNNSQIFASNLSDSSIFFHSKNCNVENQFNQHTVVRIEPQGRHKIFDQRVFENLVQEAIRSRDGNSYERLYSLTEHCIIKMSFVKGWGAQYQRQDVTSTPCWIEIHLLKPYALIDQHLRQVWPPSSQVTSTS